MKKLLLGLLLFVSCMLSTFTSNAASIIFHPFGSGMSGGANAPGWWMQSYSEDGIHHWMYYAPPSAGGTAEVFSIYYNVWRFSPSFTPPIYFSKRGTSVSTTSFANSQNASTIGECNIPSGGFWPIISPMPPYFFQQPRLYGYQLEYIVRITLNSPYSGTPPAPMPSNAQGGVVGGFGFIEGVSYDKITGCINGAVTMNPDAGTKVFDVAVCVNLYGVDTFTIVGQWKQNEVVPSLSANYLPDGNPSPYEWGMSIWP